MTLDGHGPAVSGIFTGAMGVAYSPDGSRLATVGADGTARIWDARSGEALLVMTYTSGLIRVDFSPDGALLASIGSDVLKLWDLSVLPDVTQSNPEATTLTTPRFSIPSEGRDSLFTADGRTLIQIAQFADQRMARAITLDLDTLIALARDRLTRTFTDEECLLFRIESCALEE